MIVSQSEDKFKINNFTMKILFQQVGDYAAYWVLIIRYVNGF